MRRIKLMKRLLITAAFALFVLAFSLIPAFADETEAFAASKPAVPFASAESGTYSISKNYKKISLSCETEDAVIYYKLNDGKYKKYSTPLKLRGDSVITVYSKKNGKKSETVTYEYKLRPKFTLSLKSGKYEGEQKLTVSTKVSGVTFYYTTDGKKPTTKSAVYSDGIAVSKSGKVRILAVKDGWTDNSTYRKYTIKKTEAPAPDGPDDPGTGSDAGRTGIFAKAKNGGLLYDYTSKYLYNKLNSNEKKAYRLLYESYAAVSEESCDLSAAGIDFDTAYKVWNFVLNDNPQLFYVNDGSFSASSRNGSVYQVKANAYTNPKDSIPDTFKKLEAKADSIIDEGRQTTSNTFEYVLYLHDTIVNMTQYTLGKGRDRAGTDDVLLDGKALCMGYARAFAYLCQKSGIECIIVYGDDDPYSKTADTMPDHAWNRLKLDGEWYNMDTCYDDPVDSTGRSDSCYHTYFCLTDEEMNTFHTLASVFVYEDSAATSKKYSYTENFGYRIHESGDEALDDVITQFRDTMKGGTASATIYYANDAVISHISANIGKIRESLGLWSVTLRSTRTDTVIMYTLLYKT